MSTRIRPSCASAMATLMQNVAETSWQMLLKRVSSDSIVNALIVATCCVVLGVTLQRARSVRGVSTPLAAFKAGERAEPIAGVQYDGARLTVVLYVKSTCPYCTNSMPFYGRLRAAAEALAGTRMIAVSSDSADQLARYLTAYNLHVDQVIGDFAGRALGTPTVVVVDGRGVVRGSWVGQQRADGESAIVAALSPSTSP